MSGILPPQDAHHPAPRVLVADADPDTRSLYREVLRLAGCEVVEASDGREALTQALVRTPALVLTAVRLQYLDGFALCEILRRDSMTRTAPILVVTAGGSPAELARLRQAGADAVLVKPTTPGALLREIGRLIPLVTDAANRFVTTEAARLGGSPARAEKQRRKPLAKAHIRFSTITPPEPPPDANCPSCDRLLIYDQSYIGGVSDKHSEQWDYYTCASCGTFQYRHRTRKLRHIA